MNRSENHAPFTVAAFIASTLLLFCGCDSSVDIWHAIELENITLIEEYQASGGDLEIGKSRGKTPLLYAIQADKRKAYKRLLELGAKPNTICRGGWSAMYEASEQPDEFWLNLALQFGGDPNLAEKRASGEILRTPLWCAASKGRLVCVSILVEHGADLELRNSRGDTALSIAASTIEYEIVNYLLEKGANFRNPTPEKSRFLYFVRAHMQAPIVNAQQAKWFEAVLKWLSERGINPDKITFEMSGNE